MFWSPEIGSAVQEVNNYLRLLSSENVIILDGATILAPDGRVNSQYYADELHLNAAGYAALNQELESILSKRD